MDADMKDSTAMTKNKATANLFGKMDATIVDNGKMVSRTEGVFLWAKTARRRLEFGATEKR